MLRPALLLSLGLALTGLGCAGRPGLTVQGFVTVEGTNEGQPLTTELRFSRPVRLDVVDTTAEGRITGDCMVRRLLSDTADDPYGILVEIRSGLPEGSEDQGLRSVTVMTRTDDDPSEGRVEVELLADAYQPTEAGCALGLDWMENRAGLVGLSGACQVADDDGDALQVELELDLRGCDVAR